MELSIVHHSGLPESSVVSIRAGTVRRQAPVSALGKSFKFPNAPQETVNFKVEVLDLLASARLPYNPEEIDYALSLDPVAATAGNMEIGFKVKSEASRAVSPTPAGAGDISADDASELRDRQEKEGAAKQYLESHGLTNFMQFLMASLMKDKPADPYLFLQKQVTKRMVAEHSRCQHQGAGDLLTRIADAESPPSEVTPEQLTQLEKQAEEAAAKLRQDNISLRQTADDLKSRYGQLLEESEQLQAIYQASSPERVTDSNPQTQAYNDIARMQEEITQLAEQNHALVSQMAKMREKINTMSSA
jgi:hypothetical protein